RIQPESVWPKQWQIVADLIGRDLQHQILDQHLFDACAQIGLGHNRAAIVSQTAGAVKWVGSTSTALTGAARPSLPVGERNHSVLQSRSGGSLSRWERRATRSVGQ